MLPPGCQCSISPSTKKGHMECPIRTISEEIALAVQKELTASPANMIQDLLPAIARAERSRALNKLRLTPSEMFHNPFFAIVCACHKVEHVS